jgi:hypothetical protein
MNLCPNIRQLLQGKITQDEQAKRDEKRRIEQAKIDEKSKLKNLKRTMIEILSDKDIRNYCVLHGKLELRIEIKNNHPRQPNAGNYQLALGFVSAYDGPFDEYTKLQRKIRWRPYDFFGFFYIGGGLERYIETKKTCKKEIMFYGVSLNSDEYLILKDLKGINANRDTRRHLDYFFSALLSPNIIYNSKQYEPLTAEILEDAVKKAIEQVLQSNVEQAVKDQK